METCASAVVLSEEKRKTKIFVELVCVLLCSFWLVREKAGSPIA